MLRGFELALDECLVDDHLGSNVGSFESLPSCHLLLHRLKVPLHPVHTNGNAIDERARFRVFREHGREHAGDIVSKFAPRALTPPPTDSSVPTSFQIDCVPIAGRLKRWLLRTFRIRLRFVCASRWERGFRAVNASALPLS